MQPMEPKFNKTEVTKKNDQVDICSVPPSDDFNGDLRFSVGQSVDVFFEGCWKRGEITSIVKGNMYLVAIDGREEEATVEVFESHLRVLKDWDDGSWIPPLDSQQKKSCLIGRKTGSSKRRQLDKEQEESLQENSMTGIMLDVGNNANGKRVKLRIKFGKRDLEPKFSCGTTVEVRSDEDGCQGSWYTATVVGSAGVGKFLVEYKNLKTCDETNFVANEEDIRPYPPEFSQSQRYEVLQKVDAWYNDGWWEGEISKVLDERNYIVYFASTNENLVCLHCQLRPRQNWVCGKWVLASQGGSLATNSESGTKALKLRIKPPQRNLEVKFSPGTIVEIKSDEDGYQGSWYTATVIGSAGVGKFRVEYKTLITDDGTNFLREVTNEANIRPYPPEILQNYRYQLLQEVDAWYNDGWWEVVISEVLDDWKYAVCFVSTNEKLPYQHSYLRPRQNWIHGKWVLASLSSRSIPDNYFQKGTRVEVRSDDKGYEGSWYSGKIVRLQRNGRFLVKYFSLKTDDYSHSLREEADAQNIRPFAPHVKVDNYHVLEKVDAWYNDGWWEGVISNITGVRKYMVFFELTQEEMEFDHVNLRKHQEWIDGKWISLGKNN